MTIEIVQGANARKLAQKIVDQYPPFIEEKEKEWSFFIQKKFDERNERIAGPASEGTFKIALVQEQDIKLAANLTAYGNFFIRSHNLFQLMTKGEKSKLHLTAGQAAWWLFHLGFQSSATPDSICKTVIAISKKMFGILNLQKTPEELDNFMSGIHDRFNPDSADYLPWPNPQKEITVLEAILEAHIRSNPPKNESIGRIVTYGVILGTNITKIAAWSTKQKRF